MPFENYDELDCEGQKRVRSQWSLEIEERLKNLNLEEEFRAAGFKWYEADENGNVVERE